MPLWSRIAANKSLQTATHADVSDATCCSAEDGGAAGDGGCVTTGGGDGAKAPTFGLLAVALTRCVWVVTGDTTGGRGAAGGDGGGDGSGGNHTGAPGAA